MADATAAVVNKPVWVDLSSADPTASRAFYAGLFGWDVEVSADPQYGGYAVAKIGDKDVAGIGPTQSPEAPTAWMLYIGTSDAEDLAAQVRAGGGTVIAPPFDVGDQGRMAVFQDPSGAFISAWQPAGMNGFHTNAPNTFGWAELNSRGIEKAIPFYNHVFGWTHNTREMGEGMPPYTEFQVGSESVAGGHGDEPHGSRPRAQLLDDLLRGGRR
ncbi:MAG TPA: VOC family protein [Coriobacteriia bacterium]